MLEAMSKEPRSPNEILSAALTGCSMDELRQMSEIQLNSFFSLVNKRLDKPVKPTPEEMRGLMETVVGALSHPAFEKSPKSSYS